jgi:hypothetical protein
MTEAEWLAIKDDMRKRILENGQIYIQNQIGLATAADQRAASLAAAFSAAATAVLAALVAVIGLANPAMAHPIPIIAAGILTSILFLVSAGLCITALFPKLVWLPGSEPESWYVDVEKNLPLEKCLFAEVTFLQEKIVDNRTMLQNNAINFKCGTIIGLLAPLIGGIVWAVIFYWPVIFSCF